MRLPSLRSFRGKLLLLVLLATTACVVVQSAIFRLVEVMEVKRTALAELSTDAAVIATHSAAALAFGDHDAGNETLAALDAAPQVLAARIFDDEGTLFAAYRRGGGPPSLAGPGLQGHRFDGARLRLGRPIAHGGRALGSLVMEYDLTHYYDTIRRNVLISFVIAAVAVAIGMLAAVRLQRSLARPVDDLVSTSRRISLTRDYSARVQRLNDDDLGHLVDSFNDMLAAIEARDAGLREAQAALEASNDQLQQFAYVASHDLQEPLRKIQTFASLLREDHAAHLPDEARDYVERMEAAAGRMRSLITGLLDYSRISSKEPDLTDLDLNLALEGVLSDLEVVLEESGGAVEVKTLPSVRADELHVRQLFQNLIGNALKFRRPGVPPVVRIGAAHVEDGAPGGRWRLTIEDNGIGFEPRYSDRIFLPFQRLHGRGEYDGTGMGLAVCRRIADRHGWDLAVASRPGEGTTFTITLPPRAVGSEQDSKRRPPAVKGAAA